MNYYPRSLFLKLMLSFLVKRFSPCLAVLFMTLTTAQGFTALVGVWHVDVMSGVSFMLLLNEDGSYTLETPTSSEEGVWQSDGTVLSLTDATTEETYELELYENELLLSGEGSLTQFSLTGTITFDHFTLPPVLADNAGDTPWIIGDWQSVTDTFAITHLSFLPDGSYSVAVPSQNYYGEGSWQLSGNQLRHRWQDPNTGEQQATYTLQRPDEKTFVMAGGDLGAAVLTFTRVFSQTSASTPETQTPSSFAPPQSGSYTCYIMTVGAPITTYIYSPTLGSIPVLTPTYVPSPSVIGSLILDGNGNYSSNVGNGNYNYDAATNNVTFSPPLGDSSVHYSVESGSHVLTFTYRAEDGSQDHTCSLNL
jgi:hypothetical protein